MPSSVRLNVTKTLIAYMTTRRDTEPRVYKSVAKAAMPISQMPLFVTRRSESCAKRWGTQESTAMFARIRGPVEEAGLRGDEEQRAGRDQREDDEQLADARSRRSAQAPKTLSARIAFMTLVGCGPRPDEQVAEDDAARP